MTLPIPPRPAPAPSAAAAVVAPAAPIANEAAPEGRPSLLLLAEVAAGFFLATAVTYLVPSLERFRPWVPDEPLPIVRHFLPAPEEVAPGDDPILDDDVLEALTEDVVYTPPPIEERDPEIIVDPSELTEVTQRIEDDAHAMDAFYAQLVRTARGEAGALTRIAHFGDSTIALDGITRTVRENLQRRFGDGGHGFVLAARGSLPYRHHEVEHESEGNWRIADITHLAVSDGRYGLGGVQSRGVTGASAWFATEENEESAVGRAVSRFDVLFQRHARGGHFRWRIDEGEWTEVDTHAETTTDDVLRLPVPDGPHRLELRAAGHGETRFYGVVLERDGPGVVYDSLGFVGARAARMTGFDPAHLAGQLATRGTDLVIIGFGGNDADDERSEADFEEIFREVAHLARTARPEASCLLFSVLDQGERDSRGRVVTMPTVERIVNATRSAAAAEGCAFFDAWHAMGGPGAMGRWYRRGLASSDFRHASPEGYRTLGNVFYLALLDGLREYTERNPVLGEGPAALPAPDAGTAEAPTTTATDDRAAEAPADPPTTEEPAPAPSEELP